MMVGSTKHSTYFGISEVAIASLKDPVARTEIELGALAGIVEGKEVVIAGVRGKEADVLRGLNGDVVPIHGTQKGEGELARRVWTCAALVTGALAT